MKVKIDKASAAQLAAYANTYHGLDVNYRMGAAAIVAKLEAAGVTVDEIEVEDASVQSRPPVAEPVTADAPRKKMVIMIPNQNEPGGKDPVPVGVNGKVYLIKRGVEVTVPEEVVEVLRNANKIQYDKGPNGEPINPTPVPTHNFSILGTVAA
ncbi:MAG: hypothetical protein K5872_22270 [Rhizobiaceae bacterium]|nr:hypothetical protein [Rhizobiaceae bacterium]MCV0408947.1 hypothetical protein [Rhizobiaceae bacterium]